jgi:hypothetical protein
MDYLPKLKDSILKSNYNSKLFYNMDGKENSFLFFDEIFNTLNTGILKINDMLNKLMHIKHLINIYLNFCKKGINNLQIIKELYFLLYKNNNNLAYMQLINLLLYIKDPIYLYNILLTDIKCYVDLVIDLYDILQNVCEDNSNIYHENFKGKLMHIFLCDEKKLKNKINYMINIDSNLGFLYQRNLIKKSINDNVAYNIDKCINLAVSDIVSFDIIPKINKLISNIIQHKGYFNTTILNNSQFNLKEELDILYSLNFNKLKIDFDFLLSISDKILFKTYTVQEFLESNNDFQALPNINNYNELLSIIEINHYNYKKTKNKKQKKNDMITIPYKNESKNKDEKINENINATTVAIRFYKQFVSDLKYRELYNLCKQTFDVVLNDINHPI